jgi:hypothetical protein
MLMTAVAVDQEGWLVAFYTSHRHEHRCLSRRRFGSRLGSWHLVVRDHDLAFCTLMGGEVLCASLFCSLVIWFWACFSACCCHPSGAGFLAELACRGPPPSGSLGWVVGFDSHEMAVIRGIIWSWWASHRPLGADHEEIDEWAVLCCAKEGARHPRLV